MSLRVNQLTGFGGKSKSPPDAYTVLLLHCDGADASTTFTDSSLSAHTITRSGNAQIDTAQSKFGGASALFDGSGDALSAGTSTDFAFGTGDFTIDFWIRFNNYTDGIGIIGSHDWGSAIEAGIFISSNQWIGQINSGEATVFTSTTPTNNTWYHIAMVRSGTSLKMYQNGSEIGSTTNSSNIGSTIVWSVGGSTSGGTSVNGWMDEVRVSKGIARWTTAFTPPTVPY